MRKQEAVILAKNIFDETFSEENYKRFVSNLLKQYTPIDKSREGSYIREAFRPFVSSYKIIGTFTDAGGDTIDILTVQLQKETSLERARTAQRNFIADYLKNNGKQAALVAFLSPEANDWRFSLVKLEYSLEVKEGKLKSSEEITPAKRWSFLIGDHEGSHTVKSRFLKLLQSDEEPTLAELEEAFSIEKVTNEFFQKYCDLFYRMKESLDGLLDADPEIKADFEKKEISTVDFAKKTLGQMAFLYFLQKKGWFGVAPSKEWGSGTKNFLRELFKRREAYGKNFFDEILEPLFYEALAQDRGKEAIYPRLNNCRMPFLNGGLFEPMNGYAWETTHILLPDELFSNENKTKEGDIGDGILDIFDRYNFTVNENEPLEKEVAVDPEMLGKVFENLLEIKDRKSKGAFYTPREIVHYMCQESLINYLEAETDDSITRKDLETLIQKGSQIIQNDRVVIAKHQEAKTKGREYTGTYSFMLPEVIGRNAHLLDSLLAEIKVCDPAVGSGAFPLGMLNEIVQARQVLGVHIRDGRTPYDLKLHTISNSIYGVDIDSGAVEIAKLRLWLALVVEETEPHPLPNLDHKIMQGNSLISEYEGIQLFDDSFLADVRSEEQERERIETGISELQQEYFSLHSSGDLSEVRKIELEKQIKSLMIQKKRLKPKGELQSTAMSIFDAPAAVRVAQEKTEKLQQKIQAYISESRRSQKQKLKEEIDTLKWELIEATLAEQNRTDKLEEIRELRRKNIRPFFIWKLEFSDVFQEKGGFDVVIANPPYVGESGNKDIFRPIAKSNLREFYLGKMDLFYFFFHLALDLGKNMASCAFITTNYFLTASGAKKLRSDLQERSILRNLINYNELKIFESALGQHNMITIFNKGSNASIKAQTTLAKRKGVANDKILLDIVHRADSKTVYNTVLQEELYDGEERYIRLQGTNNQENPIQIILNKVQSQGDVLSTQFNINQGVVSGCDYVSGRNIQKITDATDIEKKDGIFVLDLKNPRDVKVIESFNEKEKKLLRPFFKNSEINRYWRQTTPTKKLIYLGKESFSIDEHTNLRNHLLKFENILEDRREVQNGRIKLHQLQWYRTEDIFTKDKIVVPYRTTTNTFALSEEEWFCRSDCYVITPKTENISLKYALALLNSRLYFHWLYNRGKRKGETLELFYQPLSEIPIKEISAEEQQPFIDVVDQILAITSAANYDPKHPPARQKELEAKIDEMVFDLYGLTQEEREVVLNS